MSQTPESVPAIETLLNIMRRLRDPETGCPWDIKQTWTTIIPHTLEEVYEVADAVDRDDATALKDELGDLLFQVVFMAQIASDKGLFDFDNVAQGIADKMVRRHPHLFGDVVYDNEAEQKQAWEAIKQSEREGKKQDAFFADIPAAMPALRRSQKIQKRAARVGFDWNDWRLVVPKVQEELGEVTDAVESGEAFERIEEEVGDLLMAGTNLARQLKVDAENALRLSNNKFERRFLAVEQDLLERGIRLEDADLETMEAAWGRVKNLEKGL
ncbi:MAG: Nucleoside triphosphate pyrophosphohydrolase MazG (EC [uncultured Thiotrichaceae bacterium]|uniref:Nucleoside triphosphate pyrophosphohydrolase n=1 Tax=uncultured Thiotrichaceae bacterium TaxID=298394 RepID=A0A6S6TC64_9GAMM|nr:MAG: Nucleoside triphosphate pyrophosphohydrolase MazG (EC [uncultured Thiotrichaceae bacterium]